MTNGDSDAVGGIPVRKEFATTQWSVVRAAADSDVETARSALEELCQIYWYPLYSFVRFQGEDSSTAADLTQAFFADLLQRQDIKKVDPDLGKFRSYLLASLKNFLNNQWDKKRAQKRGGDRLKISLDFHDADQRFLETPADGLSPEQCFERQWALTLLDRVRSAVRTQFSKRGKAHVFDTLQVFLAGKNQESTIAQAANRLGMTEVATKVAIHRLRTQFGEQLRAQIQATVATESEIEDEIQHLFEVLSR